MENKRVCLAISFLDRFRMLRFVTNSNAIGLAKCVPCVVNVFFVDLIVIAEILIES